ncbi:cytochrome d ubiquinol oxidase subunit II, partial [Streptomyces sp. 2MCAF27]
AMLVPGVTVADAASTHPVLIACLLSLAVGSLILVPSLWWLYSVFQREPEPAAAPGEPGH